MPIARLDDDQRIERQPVRRVARRPLRAPLRRSHERRVAADESGEVRHGARGRQADRERDRERDQRDAPRCRAGGAPRRGQIVRVQRGDHDREQRTIGGEAVRAAPRPRRERRDRHADREDREEHVEQARARAGEHREALAPRQRRREDRAPRRTQHLRVAARPAQLLGAERAHRVRQLGRYRDLGEVAQLPAAARRPAAEHRRSSSVIERPLQPPASAMHALRQTPAVPLKCSG